MKSVYSDILHFANFIIKPFEMINGIQNTFHEFRMMENILSAK